jgi:hypothetical protein
MKGTYRKVNGSTIRTAAFAKSELFRVATVRSCVSAVAAMRLSLIGIALPERRRFAISSAHWSPVSASHGRQCKRCAPASNHRSSAVRFLPFGNSRTPNRSSPRMIGSTAMSRSFARSHSTTRGSGFGFVGSLRTLASTRYFTACLSIPIRLERSNPFLDRQGANRRHPRWGGLRAGPNDIRRGRVAQRRTPGPPRCDPSAEVRPATRFGPWRRPSFSCQ